MRETLWVCVGVTVFVAVVIALGVGGATAINHTEATELDYVCVRIDLRDGSPELQAFIAVRFQYGNGHLTHADVAEINKLRAEILRRDVAAKAERALLKHQKAEAAP